MNPVAIDTVAAALPALAAVFIGGTSIAATATLFDNVLIAFFTIYGISHGLDLAVASRVLGIGIIGNVLLSYPLGWLADHSSIEMVFRVCAFLPAIGLLAVLLPKMPRHVPKDLQPSALASACYAPKPRLWVRWRC